MGYGVVVDVGGSGTRLASTAHGEIGAVSAARVASVAELAAAVRALDVPLGAVGVSLAGRVDSDAGVVLSSRAAAWAEGPLRDRLSAALKVPVSVLGDGDAHALALTRVPDVEYGGVAISLGHSLAFGALDRRGTLLQPCGDSSWDLGHWRLIDEGTDSEAWWALGGHGLYDLERELGDGAAERYAYRLGSFLVDVIALFRPRTVLLTGGIVDTLGDALHGPVAEQLQGLPLTVDTPRLVYSPSRHTALYGAAVAAGLSWGGAARPRAADGQP